MTSFRRIAFPLGFVALCGGALLFSLTTANGQPTSGLPPTSASGAPAAPGTFSSPGASTTGAATTGAAVTGTTGTATTGSPLFPQTIGVSPVQTGKKSFVVIGGVGDGSEVYDLQNENVYSFLRQRGVPIPNVLHPLSTAKPSFIVERLIVLSMSGSSTGTGAGASTSRAPGISSSPSRSSTTPDTASGQGTTAAPDPQSYATETTILAVANVVKAELTRGTGRLGGAHRTKLNYLRLALRSLERDAASSLEAKQLNNVAADAQSVAHQNRGVASAVRREGVRSGNVRQFTTSVRVASELDRQADEALDRAIAASAGADNAEKKREVYQAQARLYARQADLYTPNLP